MIYVTSIVLKAWLRERVIAIASKDDLHTLGREAPRRNTRHDLKTDSIRARPSASSLSTRNVALSPSWPPERRTGGSIRVKCIRRDDKHLPRSFKSFIQRFPRNQQVKP
jgi:hypothetical protein